MENLKELVKMLRTYSQDIVDAKGASKEDRLRAVGAVRAYDRVLHYIDNPYTKQEESKIKMSLKEVVNG
jgi:hypothetical protein